VSALRGSAYGWQYCRTPARPATMPCTLPPPEAHLGVALEFFGLSQQQGRLELLVTDSRLCRAQLALQVLNITLGGTQLSRGRGQQG
jgi:hypothetical protein